MLNWPHLSHYLVAMVTKKTQILFFTLIFQWLKCSYSLSVAGVLFNVVLNEGEERSSGTFWHQSRPNCTFLVENENQKHEKWVRRFVKKSSKWPPFFEFLAAILEFCRYFRWFLLLENVAPSHNLILKCKIPINSVKQSMFIWPAKFKPYFSTRACKWIGFSQILPHISLSLIDFWLIKMARNPT